MLATETTEEAKVSGDSALINLFNEQAAQIVSDSPEEQIKKSRILLNKVKMESMLGRLAPNDGNAASTHECAKSLLASYLEYAKRDGKPEKGERKIADDFVLILDEVLQGRGQGADLLRIGVLEYALAASPYNFDM